MVSVSPHIRQLLRGPLDSFDKLEMVVALWKAPAHTSSARELAARVQLPVDLIERATADLTVARLVEVAGGLIRLTPTALQSAAVADLVTLYDEDRILIVRVLSEIAMDKIRGMAARAFADAFQVRKKPEDDDG